tara:strand:+ start:32925 stop:33983 length:1059 start_codon:yes stop_codon:yes gene_type:complete
MADQEVVVSDRREAIAAALDQAEKADAQPTIEAGAAGLPPAVPVPDAPPAEKAPAEKAPAEKALEVPTGEAAETVAPVLDQVQGLDRAPQAWKAPLKAKWDKLDPDVRQEVLRRERETTQVLNDTAQARQFTQQFGQAIQPFQERLTKLGAHPIQAVRQLLAADQYLSSAPAPDRAKYMAKLIHDYGVDIAQLDEALAKAPASNQVASQVDQLVQQRLAPFQSFMQQQTEQQRQQQALAAQAAQQTVEQMSQDPKYPYFDRVRVAMADLIDFSSQRGQPLTIEAAYNKAIALDSAISQEIAAKHASETARVSRALNASSSISGNPTGAVSSNSVGTDRRATIEAAFGAVESR